MNAIVGQLKEMNIHNQKMDLRMDALYNSHLHIHQSHVLFNNHLNYLHQDMVAQPHYVPCSHDPWGTYAPFEGFPDFEGGGSNVGGGSDFGDPSGEAEQGAGPSGGGDFGEEMDEDDEEIEIRFN